MSTPLNDRSVTATAVKKKADWDENIKTLLIAGIFAILFRSFLVEPFHIPSGSMKDTLLIGDYLFVSKYSYGYSRYSFPFGFPLFEGRIFETLPKRGDVVVFRPPGVPQTDYIKRLVGLPGDHIQVKLGELYINEQRVPRIPAGDYPDDNYGETVIAKRYIESLPGSDGSPVVEHDILDRGEIGADPTGVDADNTMVYTVPPKHYFMMGDNRDNSRDSRFAFPVGFVPEENLVGPAKFILFSIGGDNPFWQIWKWPGELRWNRFFRTIR